MKKLLLMSAVGLLSTAAGAQNAQKLQRSNALDTKASAAKMISAGSRFTASQYDLPAATPGTGAKTSATAFYTETFGSGTSTSLPNGWTATSTTGFPGGWRWANKRAGGNFSLSPIQSTTAADGWMLYDSDSVGKLSPTAKPFGGSLISPTYVTTGHNTVQVSFQQRFVSFGDSCFFAVSTDGGATWTENEIRENAALDYNESFPTNPYTTYINVSSVAANKPSVKFRFRYSSNYAGGSYNWMIDDFTVSEMDAVQVALSGSGLIQTNNSSTFTNPYSGYGLFNNIPLQLVDTVYAVSNLTNKGYQTQQNIPLNVKIFKGTNLVLDESTTYASLGDDAVDSATDYGSKGYYIPTDTGLYTVAFSANQPNDAYATDNVDTNRFRVNNVVYATHGRTVTGSSFIYRKAGSSPAFALYNGARFDIPAGRNDTVTSVDVAFGPGTAVNQRVVVELYKIGPASGSGYKWTPVIATNEKVLAASDINTALTATPSYANFTFTARASSLSTYVLTPGTYAAMVRTIGATDDVLLIVGNSMKPDAAYSGYFGHRDTANNGNAGFTFGANSGLRTGSLAVPYVHLRFANNARDSIVQSTTPPPGGVGVTQIAGVTVGDAYPNPANTSLSIPVATTVGKNMTVSITNMVGQVMKTESLGNVNAGQTKKVVFNTSDLAAGVYLYTVEADGERVTKQVIIAH